MSASRARYIRDKPILTSYEELFTPFYSSIYEVKSLTDNICTDSVRTNLNSSTILAHTRQLPCVTVITVGATFVGVLAVFTKSSVLPESFARVSTFFHAFRCTHTTIRRPRPPWNIVNTCRTSPVMLVGKEKQTTYIALKIKKIRERMFHELICLENTCTYLQHRQTNS